MRAQLPAEGEYVLLGFNSSPFRFLTLGFELEVEFKEVKYVSARIPNIAASNDITSDSLEKPPIELEEERPGFVLLHLLAMPLFGSLRFLAKSSVNSLNVFMVQSVASSDEKKHAETEESEEHICDLRQIVPY